MCRFSTFLKRGYWGSSTRAGELPGWGGGGWLQGVGHQSVPGTSHALWQELGLQLMPDSPLSSAGNSCS